MKEIKITDKCLDNTAIFPIFHQIWMPTLCIFMQKWQINLFIKCQVSETETKEKCCSFHSSTAKTALKQFYFAYSRTIPPLLANNHLKEPFQFINIKFNLLIQSYVFFVLLAISIKSRCLSVLVLTAYSWSVTPDLHHKDNLAPPTWGNLRG